MRRRNKNYLKLPKSRRSAQWKSKLEMKRIFKSYRTKRMLKTPNSKRRRTRRNASKKRLVLRCIK